MRRSSCALALAAIVATATWNTSQAHPPFNPFDDTVFAPITRFGPLITLETVATGLVAPNKGVTAPGEPGRLYLVDQPGVIWALDFETQALTKFLDVGPSGLNLLVVLGVFGPDTFDERGLLGLAFHPRYRQNGRLYTYTSEPNAGPPTFPTTLPVGTPADHQNVLSEWIAVDPGDPAKGVQAGRRELLRVDWPQFNHDGGDLAFGPDRKLYLSMGDGGGADDTEVGHAPDGNGQTLTNPLGKILRIDVDGSDSGNGQYGIPRDNPFRGDGGGVLDEIFAYGFRNPFRFSFDRKTGRLYVGDVGQNDIEEVDVVVAGGNYGWHRKEGTLFFDPNGDGDGFATPDPPGPVPPGLIGPIAQYDTHHEGHSVIGGFVYRGKRLRGLQGRYLFADFSLLFKFPSGPHDYGRLFHLDGRRDGGKKHHGSNGRALRPIREFHITPGNAVSLAVLGMGEDAAGEVYVMGNISGVPFGDDGVVMRLAPHHDDHHDD